MSAAALIMRIVIASVAVIAVGAIGVIGFMVIEPFYVAFGDPPSGLGWGSPGGGALTFASFGFIGLLITLVIWFVSAPIRNDQRQGYR